jgi:two-component system CheB/CheR fusion protein
MVEDAMASSESFPVVGVGGSAGSLSAFQELLNRLSAEAAVALVIVSHQDPDRPSLLAEILAKSAHLPVAQAAEGGRAEPGRVYVAPPGRYLSIREGVFHLEHAVERGHPPLPVDFFLRSLAEDLGTRAVGIVLSGTGSDGTLGLAAIRSEAGLTLAQPPDEAEFGGMPGNAVAAGVVDLVLSPADMARRLVSHAQHLASHRAPVVAAPRAADDLERVLELVAAHTGQDFSAYKRGTLQRRIERRLHLHGQRNLSEYLHFVEDHPEELDALWRDWLIGVSGFFRDAEAFQALETALFELLRGRPDGSTVRAWVPGCAMGQEAYSVAIVMLEVAERLGTRLEPQIFATDIDEVAIEAARSGRYPEGIAADVSPERLRRFFVVDDRQFVVKKDIRERVVFAVQNLLRDPPFTRVDLISCRNLLIYLRQEAQKRVLPLFHYSLNPRGLLFLGSSESVTGFDELFSTVSRERRIFRRQETNRPAFEPAEWAASLSRPPPLPQGEGPGEEGEEKRRKADLGELLRRQLSERYAPPAVILDEQGKVEQIHGRTGEYLEPAPGQPNLNVLDMARDGLRSPLASALREIARNGQRAVERDARVRTNGGQRRVHLRLVRLPDQRLPRPLFLLSFESDEPRKAPPAAKPETRSAEAAPAVRVTQLEEELRAMREDHQSTVEELQAANEELASANEEVQSVNEELQSTNEELQTSKEETQSLNEELQTVNAELRARLSSLEQANDDLRNLMDSTGIALVFADEGLRVKRFTPAAQRLVPLIVSDVGRPLSDISMTLAYPDLLADAQEVLRSLAPCEREVQSSEGGWYSVEIRPYRTSRNTIEGVSIAFLDTTRTKLAAEQARAFEEGIVEAVREPFLVLDAGLTVVRANRSFYRAFRVEPAEVERRSIFELGNGQWDIPRLRELLERLLPENHSFDDFEVEHEFPQIGRRVMLLNARRVERTRSGQPDLILLAIEDVTERRAHGPEASG